MLFSFYLKDQYLGRRPIPMGTRPAPKVCAVAGVLFHYDGEGYRCEDDVAAEKVAKVIEQLAEMEMDAGLVDDAGA